MRRACAFTLTEALVIIGVAVVLVALAIALSVPTRRDPEFKNQQHMKAIVMAFSLWPNPNTPDDNIYLPGALDDPYDPIHTSNNYPANGRDPSVVGRFWALVAAPGTDPLRPRILVNPKPGVPEAVWSNPNCTISPGVTTATAAGFGSNNVSYALLSTKTGFHWRNNACGICPFVCDRNRGTPAAPTSSWSSTGWKGNVGWGDGHVTFETSPIFSYPSPNSNSYDTSNLWVPGTSANYGMVNPGE
jgi:prepilin-type processing-associated H-X9-DG protein